MKQDIRNQSDAELSLLVFNDETLYKLRRNRRALRETLRELYTFSAVQLAELYNDLDLDASEGEA